MKSESEVRKKHLQRSAGKFMPMDLLLASNDTVPISVWHGQRSTECRLVTLLSCYI